MVWFLSGEKNFPLFSEMSRRAFGTMKPLILSLPEALSPVSNSPFREADGLFPSSVESNNAWSFTPTSSYDFTSWRLVKNTIKLRLNLQLVKPH
jgi:hypothetical protein